MKIDILPTYPLFISLPYLLQMKFNSDFKKALSQLPDKEKDKLILRLLRKDLDLANKLHFELMEDSTVEERREETLHEVLRRVKVSADAYYSPGYLLLDLRDNSGIINEHVRITKDKLGEVILQCAMIRQALELCHEKMAMAELGKIYTLGIYLISRVFKIMMLIQKLHPDYYIQFQEDLKSIGENFGKVPNLMKMAINNGLDINWLLNFEIPEDIADIHKDLRKRGYLR
jgi:hypothetical protein